VFRGERKMIPSFVISIVTTKKLIRNGCPIYLAHVKELRKGSLELTIIFIVREFQNVFPEELPRQPTREIEVNSLKDHLYNTISL
jgi:hypothetical protein